MPGGCGSLDPRWDYGVPLDAARPALVSELFVGEAPGNGSVGVFVPGSHGLGIRGSFLSVTVGIANMND